MRSIKSVSIELEVKDGRLCGDVEFEQGKIDKRRGFCQMAYQDTLNDLAKRKLAGSAYSVLILMLANADYNNVCSLHQGAIARSLDLAREVVSRAIKDLEALGYVAFHQNVGLAKIYKVSPYLIFRCSAAEHKKMMAEWDSKFETNTVKLGDRSKKRASKTA